MADLLSDTETTSSDVSEIRDIIGLPGLFEAKTKEFLTQKYSPNFNEDGSTHKVPGP